MPYQEKADLMVYLQRLTIVRHASSGGTSPSTAHLFPVKPISSFKKVKSDVSKLVERHHTLRHVTS